MTDKDTSEVDVSGRLHVPNSNRPILKSNKYLSLYNVHLQKQHGINKHVVGEYTPWKNTEAVCTTTPYIHTLHTPQFNTSITWKVYTIYMVG